MFLDGNGRLTEQGLSNFEGVVNDTMNPIKYLGIDPGGKNGVCGYDGKFYLQFMMTLVAEDIAPFLNTFHNLETVVIEGFRLFPNKAKEQFYSDMLTPRVIGRVEAWTNYHEVKLVTQPSSIKPTAYAWIGEKPPKKSDAKNHEKDAHAHFMYWVIKNNLIKPEDLLKKNISNELS